MATSSAVKAGLDEISSVINASRQRLTSAKAMVATQETNLAALPTRFDDVISTINAYTPAGAFETLAKDELSKLAAEFTALQAAATDAKTDLATQTEF